MKIKLNIKSKKKFYHNVNIPVLAAFMLAVIIGGIWMKVSYNAHRDYSAKIKARGAQIIALKTKSVKKEADTKVIESKLFIDSNNLDRLHAKIKFLEKFAGTKKSAFRFFDILEKAVTGEVFINNIVSDIKKNEFNIEGSSSNADNISEFIKNLQSGNLFSGVELLKITGGARESRSMNFSAVFVYNDGPELEFKGGPTPGPGFKNKSARDVKKVN